MLQSMLQGKLPAHIVPQVILWDGIFRTDDGHPIHKDLANHFSGRQGHHSRIRPDDLLVEAETHSHAPESGVPTATEHIPSACHHRTTATRLGMSVDSSTGTMSSTRVPTPAATLVCAAWVLVVGKMMGSNNVTFGAVITESSVAVNSNRMESLASKAVTMSLELPSNRKISEYLAAVQQRVVLATSTRQSGWNELSGITSKVHPVGGISSQEALVIETPTPLENTRGCSTQLRDQMCDAVLCIHISPDAITLATFFRPGAVQSFAAQHLPDLVEFGTHQLRNCRPDQTLDEIEMTSPDHTEVIWSWNCSVPRPIDMCVHDMIQDTVRAQPHAMAVSAWDGGLTYEELDNLAATLATRIVSFGLRPGMIVPLCFEKSMWTTVAMLGVMKAGVAFLLLDALLPEQRLREIVAQVNASLLLSSPSNQALSSRLEKNAVVFVVNVESLQCIDTLTPRHPAESSGPSSIMYVIFTSGSTGTPKGVMITHRNLASAIYYQRDIRYIDRESRVFEFSSYSFDACVYNAMKTLVVGGCLCTPSDDDRRDNLAQSLVSTRATVLEITPSALRLLDPTAIPGLQTLVCAGEQLKAHDIEPWLGKVRVVNSYGPSECTPASTFNDASTEPQEMTRIGKGYGLVTWIVEPDNIDCLAPLGCVGELLLEGPLVGPGYLDDPTRTAASFVRDPQWLLRGGGGKPGRHGRLYKTGDLVRYNEDGSLSFIGRKDTQVKIRGQRVELGEIECAVQKYMPEATQVVVEVFAPDGKASPVLAVFVRVVDTRARIDKATISWVPHEMERSLAENLPGYMVPHVVVSLPEFPMTPTGKIDRRALRELGRSLSTQQKAKMPTAEAERHVYSKVEQQLRLIWSQILDVHERSIGLEDRFLQLGGDSITAMRVSAAARAVSINIRADEVLREKTIAKLARTLSPSHAGVRATPVASFPSSHTSQQIPSEGSLTLGSEVSEAKPLPSPGNGAPTSGNGALFEQSHRQEGLWFLHHLHPQLAWYVLPFAVRLRGPLQLSALHTAVLALERRHETLRTTFVSIDGANLQRVHPFQPKDLKVIDVSSTDEEEAMGLLRADQETKFNLETEPGWRVSVFRRGIDDHILSVVLHHIIHDGWSMDVLCKELARFYSAALRGQDPLSHIEPLHIQYRDYAAWEREQSSEEAPHMRRQVNYWVTQLETSWPAILPYDNPRPATFSGLADILRFKVEGELYQRLRKFCIERDVTPFVVFLAAFRATHYRLTGSSDATIGIANANRAREEVKNILGFFVNMQCIRTRVDHGSFEELIQQVQEVTLLSLANADVPFDRILSQLRITREIGRHPLVQIGFALHSQSQLGKFHFEGVDSQRLESSMASEFDLELHFYQEEHDFRGEVLFSVDLYNHGTISNMLSVFRKVLEGGMNEPHVPLSSLPLCSDDDLERLDELGLIRVHRTDYPRDSSVVDVFRQQVVASPGRTSVKDASTQLTYAELDRASDLVAGWLAAKSFPPETLIGVLGTRSSFTTIAFLGILKANLAYLPLDAKTPIGRLEDILSVIQGHKLVLLTSDTPPPVIASDDLVFVHIQDVLVGQDKHDCASQSPPLRCKTSARSLAYVMFTSGSTGRPKGVMAEHRNILRLVKQSNYIEHLPAAPVMAHISSIAFDMSTTEIYSTLVNGGTLICVDDADVLDCSAMSDIFLREGVGALMITPALLKQYLTGCPAALSQLSLLQVGGDRTESKDMLAAQQLIKGTVQTGYGPTENTGVSTIYTLPNQDARLSVDVPFGRTVSNSGAYVMDTQQQLVPLGVVGELAVTGDGLARGYINPRDNVDRFVTVLIGGEECRAYRTGDLARWRPKDGELEYLGRSDDQVKIRGHRVELGEIESLLRSQDCVAEAVALLQGGNGQEARLVGFLTCRNSMEDGQDMEEKLYEVLRSKLPSYMVPESLTILDKMPVNQNGKINRQALAKRPQQPTTKREPLQQPASESERQMQVIWGCALRRERDTIGLHDNFFGLGGTSISAMMVVSEARRVGFSLSIVDVLRRPVLHDLVNRITRNAEPNQPSC